jgi:hypothetical protein
MWTVRESNCFRCMKALRQFLAFSSSGTIANVNKIFNVMSSDGFVCGIWHKIKNRWVDGGLLFHFLLGLISIIIGFYLIFLYYFMTTRQIIFWRQEFLYLLDLHLRLIYS